MSAYMVNKEHIDALVATAIDGPKDGPGMSRWHDMMQYNLRGVPAVTDPLLYSELEQRVGEMLVKENLSSIHHRYPDTIGNPDNTPGPCEQYWLEEYNLPITAQRNRLTIVQTFKALDCYEYQSCEHPEWAISDAKKFCDGFRDNLISALPGYEQAAWEICATA